MADLYGVVAALATPFDETGEELDEAGLRNHLDSILEAGVHGIAIEQEISDQISEVHGDLRHLQQVLVNLLNNAIDAVITRHGSSGGTIRVESGPAGNGHVEIKIHDNGSGISSENLKKVFTPFFTTKPVGKGTGLGLSVCYGIIDKMGGSMAVASQENVGTTFTIRLPVGK